mmetsp:Transcript_26214/g.55242  ORF Transcript_26214/g.55242 Transcript_26214/m.55242 type:complete len:231 (-) Transcript_26214:2173-2865(-)
MKSWIQGKMFQVAIKTIICSRRSLVLNGKNNIFSLSYCKKTFAITPIIYIQRNRSSHGIQNFYQPPTPPILFDMVLRNDWSGVLQRVKSHPHEASYRHPRGWTALHCSVEAGAPLDVVEAIVEAFPKSLNMKDWKGRSAEEVALYRETRDYLKKINSGDLKIAEQVTYNTSSCRYDDETLESASRTQRSNGSHELETQIEKISEELVRLEDACQSLRKELNSLTEMLTSK